MIPRQRARRVVVGASWEGAELNLGDRVSHPLLGKASKTVVKLSRSRGCLYIHYTDGARFGRLRVPESKLSELTIYKKGE